MSQADLEKWQPAAKALKGDDFNFHVPLHVLLGEAVDVAKFHEKYWNKGESHAGLQSAVRKGRENEISPKTGQEILELQGAAQTAHTAFLLSVGLPGTDPSVRGAALVSELAEALTWYFDDGVDDERDLQLTAIEQAHADDPASADALASELEDYAALAEAHRKALDGLGDFDVADIEEARAVAKALRDRAATPQASSPEQRAAMSLRNRLLTLLTARMGLVRGAARFAFRRKPDIIREATSAFERRRRAKTRARAKKESEKKPA